MSDGSNNSETERTACGPVRSSPSGFEFGIVFLLTSLCSVIALGFGTWRGSISNGDDPLYAMCARDMLESGRWAFLSLNDSVVLSYPPGATWAVAASMAMFGENEFALRFPAVLAHALTVGLTASIGLSAAGRAGAVVAASTLLTSTLFFSLARAVMTDHLMLLGMAVTAFGAFVRTVDPRLRAGMMGVGLGLAMMAKQVVPVLLCAVPMLAALQSTSPLRINRPAVYTVALALAIAIALLLPWHLTAWMTYGDQFVYEFLVRNVLLRASSALLSPTDPLYYWHLLADREALIVVLISVAILKALHPRWRDPATFWWALWAASILIPFSMASTRLPHYILPAFVPMALLVTTLLYGVSLRRQLAGALVFGALVSGLLSNGSDAVNPDYSPDEKRFGLWLRQNAPEHRVASFEHYGQAIFWYAHRPLGFLTAQPIAYEAMNRGILADFGAVQLVDQTALRTLLQTEQICVQHPPTWTPQLKSLAPPESVVVEGLYTNLLCNRLP
jgi:4-amino-4-deoxy-L-arabinose transferase-like glycosyltransferase